MILTAETQRTAETRRRGEKDRQLLSRKGAKNAKGRTRFPSFLIPFATFAPLRETFCRLNSLRVSASPRFVVFRGVLDVA